MKYTAIYYRICNWKNKRWGKRRKRNEAGGGEEGGGKKIHRTMENKKLATAATRLFWCLLCLVRGSTRHKINKSPQTPGRVIQGNRYNRNSEARAPRQNREQLLRTIDNRLWIYTGTTSIFAIARAGAKNYCDRRGFIYCTRPGDEGPCRKKKRKKTAGRHANARAD